VTGWYQRKMTCVTIASPGDETSLNLLLISVHSYGELFDPGRRQSMKSSGSLIFQGFRDFFVSEILASPLRHLSINEAGSLILSGFVSIFTQSAEQ